jgi:hypothetical protein
VLAVLVVLLARTPGLTVVRQSSVLARRLRCRLPVAVGVAQAFRALILTTTRRALVEPRSSGTLVLEAVQVLPCTSPLTWLPLPAPVVVLPEHFLRQVLLGGWPLAPMVLPRALVRAVAAAAVATSPTKQRLARDLVVRTASSSLTVSCEVTYDRT